jgi:hypothetical protein
MNAFDTRHGFVRGQSIRISKSVHLYSVKKQVETDTMPRPNPTVSQFQSH